MINSAKKGLVVAVTSLVLLLMPSVLAQESRTPEIERQMSGRLWVEDQTIPGAAIEGSRITFEVKIPETAQIKEARIGKEKIRLKQLESPDKGCSLYRGVVTLKSGMYREGDAITAGAKILYEGSTFELCPEEILVYYEKPEILSFEWSTENDDPGRIKNGERLMLSVRVSHASSVKAIVGQQEMILHSEDGALFKGEVLADHLVEDQERIPCRLILSDAFGQIQKMDAVETARYWAPLKLESLTQESDNLVDGERFLIDGNQMIIKGKVNHPAKIRFQSGEQLIELATDENLFEIRTSAELLEKEDQKTPRFSIELFDEAGNRLTGMDQSDCPKTLTYFAPIEATVQTEVLECVTPGFLKNGMTLSSVLNANHVIEIKEAEYIGRSGAISQAQGEEVSSTFRISETEDRLTEGEIDFSAILIDQAGNHSVLTEKTGWIYDRTPPKGGFSPQKQGFFNQDLQFKIHFDDPYLQRESLKLVTNGKQESFILQETDKGIEAVFQLKKEGRYQCQAEVMDLAGNRADSGMLQVIIDKTVPSMTAVNIEMEDKPVYPAGFVLSDYFKISDTYLKSIDCTLTDRQGFGRTQLWDMDAPILEDGFKTAEFWARDHASNCSEKWRFQFYIDGTAPQIKVTDRRTGREIENGETVFVGTELEVSLVPLWFSKKLPDQFERICGKQNETEFEYSPEELKGSQVQIDTGKQGPLKLRVSARDEAGNRLEQEFSYEVKARTLRHQKEHPRMPASKVRTPLENMMRWGLLGVVAAVITIIFIGIIKKKIKTRNPSDSGKEDM